METGAGLQDGRNEAALLTWDSRLGAGPCDPAAAPLGPPLSRLLPPPSPQTVLRTAALGCGVGDQRSCERGSFSPSSRPPSSRRDKEGLV